jgi:hypothetical protein
MKTIEAHYNNLLSAQKSSQQSADFASAETWDTLLPVAQPEGLRDRIGARATYLAAQDWPRVRSAIAAKGDQLPTSAIEFANSGYPQNYVRNYGVFANRMRRACEPDYVEAARKDMAAELRREADIAAAAFEAYRRAVEQGVAVAPLD